MPQSHGLSFVISLSIFKKYPYWLHKLYLIITLSEILEVLHYYLPLPTLDHSRWCLPVFHSFGLWACLVGLYEIARSGLWGNKPLESILPLLLSDATNTKSLKLIFSLAFLRTGRCWFRVYFTLCKGWPVLGNSQEKIFLTQPGLWQFYFCYLGQIYFLKILLSIPYAAF